jgi:1-acyl-sn-glycerol-3-phosphate acyltransferase
MLYAILKPIAVVLMRLLFRLEARGTEHIPRSGALVIVANHSSVLDPPLVGGAAPRPLTYLAKAELFDIPLLGALIRGVNARPLRRDGADAGALRTALRVLDDGGALLVFPEGTRGPEGVLREPKAGAAMLAILGGAPVVPTYIKGSGAAWPKGRRLPRPAKVVVTFGPPLTFQRAPGVDRKAHYEATSRALMAAIARLGGLTTAAPAGATSAVRDVTQAGRASWPSARSKIIDGRN